MDRVKHAKWLAMSTMKNESIKIATEDMSNDKNPPNIEAGGIKAANSFQGQVIM